MVVRSLLSIVQKRRKLNDVVLTGSETEKLNFGKFNHIKFELLDPLWVGLKHGPTQTHTQTQTQK